MLRSPSSAPARSDEVRRLVDGLEGDLCTLRRDLHRHPELSGTEQATAGVVARWLGGLGLAVSTGVGGTGVVADLAGKMPGPVLMLRADMDALPITERTNLAFTSRVPGVMHACGHDAHTAALLGVASVLATMTSRLAGTVRFCFQPAEEILAGAAPMIAAGVLDGVSGVAGAHVDSRLPLGTIATTAGQFLAGADLFEIRVRGGGGHAARPGDGVDPLFVACHLVAAAQGIISRETKPGEPLVLTFGALESGGAANIVVEEVVLKGTLRWFKESERDRALSRLESVMNGVCQAFRAHGTLRVTASAPVTCNHAAAVDRLSSMVADTGRTELIDSGRLTVSDDMALFLQQVPGVYFLAGASAHGAPHHHPEFDIDEGVIGLICETLVRYTLSYLQQGD